MNKKVLRCLLLLSILFLVGCGDSHDKATRDSIRVTKQFVTVLKGIENAEDAKAAKSKLESIGKKMAAIQERMKKLDDPTPEQQKQLEKKYGEEMKEVMGELVGVMFKTMDPEISAEIGPVMEQFSKP